MMMADGWLTVAKKKDQVEVLRNEQRLCFVRIAILVRKGMLFVVIVNSWWMNGRWWRKKKVSITTLLRSSTFVSIDRLSKDEKKVMAKDEKNGDGCERGEGSDDDKKKYFVPTTRVLARNDEDRWMEDCVIIVTISFELMDDTWNAFSSKTKSIEGTK